MTVSPVWPVNIRTSATGFVGAFLAAGWAPDDPFPSGQPGLSLETTTTNGEVSELCKGLRMTK